MTKNNWINVWPIQKKVLPLQWGNQGARAEAVDSTSVGVDTKKSGDLSQAATFIVEHFQLSMESNYFNYKLLYPNSWCFLARFIILLLTLTSRLIKASPNLSYTCFGLAIKSVICLSVLTL